MCVTIPVLASLAICFIFPPVVVTLLALEQVSPKVSVEAALRYLAFTEPQRTPQQQPQETSAKGFWRTYVWEHDAATQPGSK